MSSPIGLTVEVLFQTKSSAFGSNLFGELSTVSPSGTFVGFIKFLFYVSLDTLSGFYLEKPFRGRI